MISAIKINKDLLEIKANYGEEAMMAVCSAAISFHAINWNTFLQDLFKDKDFIKIINKEHTQMGQEQIILQRAAEMFPEKRELPGLELYAKHLENEAMKEKEKNPDSEKYGKLAKEFLNAKILYRKLEKIAKKNKQAV